VVHGHVEGMLDAVTTELKRLDIVPVVPNRVRTSNDHLFANFKAVASDAKHAIVLISGDDAVPLSATSCIQRELGHDLSSERGRTLFSRWVTPRSTRGRARVRVPQGTARNRQDGQAA
jgi:hypothetical protein